MQQQCSYGILLTSHLHFGTVESGFGRLELFGRQMLMKYAKLLCMVLGLAIACLGCKKQEPVQPRQSAARVEKEPVDVPESAEPNKPARPAPAERETAAAAVVLDIQPDVMIGVCCAAPVDLGVDALFVAVVTGRPTPELPGGKPGRHGRRVFDTDYAPASQAVSYVAQHPFCSALGFHLPFL